jgi:hypothetical protein
MTHLARALVLATLTFGTLVTLGGTAAAEDSKHEPTAGDLATARAALKEGLALREKGELPAAIMRFQTAWDLVPTPVTGFELGKTQMMAGKILQAQEHFQKVVRMPASMEESERSKVAREESARLAKEIEPRIPSLAIKVKLPAGASAVVRIDDENVPLSGAVTTRAVDPGSHDVVATAGDGPEQHVRVEVAESEVKEVELTPQWVPPKIDAKKEKGQVVIVREKTSVLTFIGFAGASAGLATTLISGYVWLGLHNELVDKCGDRYCPETNNRQITIRNTWLGLTVASGAATLAFLAAGVVGVTNPKKESVVVGGARVRPAVGLGSLALEGTF